MIYNFVKQLIGRISLKNALIALKVAEMESLYIRLILDLILDLIFDLIFD